VRRIIDALQSDTKRDGEGYEDRFLISAYTASVFSRKDHTLTVGRNL